VRDVRLRVLRAADFDAAIVLLSLLIVAVCGTAQLMLMLPHALGAAMRASDAGRAYVVGARRAAAAPNAGQAQVASQAPGTADDVPLPRRGAS
jgi:hypothetical protein